MGKERAAYFVIREMTCTPSRRFPSGTMLPGYPSVSFRETEVSRECRSVIPQKTPEGLFSYQ